MVINSLCSIFHSDPATHYAIIRSVPTTLFTLYCSFPAQPQSIFHLVCPCHTLQQLISNLVLSSSHFSYFVPTTATLPAINQAVPDTLCSLQRSILTLLVLSSAHLNTDVCPLLKFIFHIYFISVLSF